MIISACIHVYCSNSLPSIIPVYVACTSQETVHTTIDDLIQIKKFNTTLNCSKGFTVDPSTVYCVPVCGEWSEFSQNTTLFFRIIATAFYVIHTLGTVAALGLSSRLSSLSKLFYMPFVQLAQ